MSTIDTLEAEAEKHRLIVKKIESLIRDLQEIGQPQEELALPRAGEQKVNGQEAAPTTQFRGMRQIEAIEAIIKAKGQATARDIFEALQAGGIPVKRMAYISSVLSRSEKRFERVGRGRKSRWKLALPQPN